MKRILVLTTGLYPDAPTVAAALAADADAKEIVRIDVSGLAPEDERGWAEAADAVLSADLIVAV